MIDTHSHIQFKIFDDNRGQVINNAKKAGVDKIMAVGTDLESSEKAVEIAEKYPEVYASAGIHPHHAFEFLKEFSSFSNQLSELQKLLGNPKVVAIGETGIDKHVYKKTKYTDYLISKGFLKVQKELFAQQIQMATKHKKSLIIHNREAVNETLEILTENWSQFLEGRSVFHFCEPDKRLLDFALKHKVYIGIDADVLTDLDKQSFVKMVPQKLLVLETDSPFISPEPKNLIEILEFVSKLLKIETKVLERIIFNNSLSLFKLQLKHFN